MKSDSSTDSAGSEVSDSDSKEPIVIEDFYKGRKTRKYRGEAPTLRGNRHGLKVAVSSDVSVPTTSTSTPTKSTQPDSEKKTIIQATLGESIQGTSPIMTSFAEAFLAKPSLLPEKGKVSKILVERFSSRYTELSKTKDLSCYSLKMFRDSCLRELSSVQNL